MQAALSYSYTGSITLQLNKWHNFITIFLKSHKFYITTVSVSPQIKISGCTPGINQSICCQNKYHTGCFPTEPRPAGTEASGWPPEPWHDPRPSRQSRVTILDFIGFLYKVHKMKGSWGSNCRSLSCCTVNFTARKKRLHVQNSKEGKVVCFLDKRRVQVAAVDVARP